MKQQTVNAAVFGLLGVILGIVLATVAGYDDVAGVAGAIVVCGGLGVAVGWNWPPPTGKE